MSAQAPAPGSVTCGIPDGVFVTGAHRSGTTLLGEVVAQAPDTWTVWEPWNQHWGLRVVTRAYPYLDSSAAASAPVEALARYLATGRAQWSVKRGPDGARLPWLKERLRGRRRWQAWHEHASATPVVKDPFVLLAMAALQPRLTTRPFVIAIRHPCSWLASLRRMGWPAAPELDSLAAQRALRPHLDDILPRTGGSGLDDVTAAALAWACLYHMVDVQMRSGVRVHVVPLERFAEDPVTTMTDTYRVLGLGQPVDVPKLAADYTRGKTVTPGTGTKHHLSRDSRRLTDAWKSVLTTEEIATVRSITEPIYSRYYHAWEEPGRRRPAAPPSSLHEP